MTINKVPLLDLQAQLKEVGEKIKEKVCAVIDSGVYILGAEVKQLEEEVARYCGASYGVGLSSGTDALLIALMALEVRPGDIVITTPYSFFASAGVIARLNATPVFVDIEPASFNMDPAKLALWFEQNPSHISKVKAIIPIHLYGQCADMERILALSSKYGIPVIEDGAQAIGAKVPFQGAVRSAGSLGLMGCLSFFPSKNLGGLGDGGMVITSDKQLAEKLLLLRNHGAKPKYYHSLIGGNFRIDTIQAAALLVKLPYLEGWHERRRKNARYYDSHLNDISQITLPRALWGTQTHIYNQYVIMTEGRRDELRHFLSNEKHIGNEVYYPVPFHLQECFKSLGYKKGDFPLSEKAALQSLALPIYPELTEDMQAYVVAAIKEFYEK